MLRPLLCIPIFLGCVSAVAFRAPQPTSCADVGVLLSPPEPTGGMRLPPLELLRRDLVTVDLVAPDNTCGYISGRAGAAYYCYSNTDKCAVFPGTSNSAGYIGCCNTDSCGARVTCIDRVGYFSSSLCDNGCLKDTFTLKCTALTAPYCNGVSFADVNARDYFCDSDTISTWQTAFTTFSGESDGRAFSPITITVSTDIGTTTRVPSTTPTTTTSTSSSPPSNPTTVVNGGDVSPSSTSIAPPIVAVSSGPPIGAIVGGVVGGIAAIALVVLAVFFIMRSRKKDNANNGAAPPSYAPGAPDNSAYAAAAAGKPGMTQTTLPEGPWVPANQGNAYSHPPPQQPYEPLVQHQQPYPPPQQQQYPPVSEVQGSIPGQPTMDPRYSQYPSPNPTFVQPTSPSQTPGQISPNSQHLSSAFPDQITSPLSTHRAFELGVPGGAHPMSSPTPSHATMGPSPTGVTGAAAPSTEGRAEMSANMAGGPFPMNLHDGTYEVPG